MTQELDHSSSIADQIIYDLSNLGYICRKDTSRAVSVYAERSIRTQIINQLIEQLPQSEYNPHAGTSSLGLIFYRGGSIRIRPLKNSKISSGIENESILATTINFYIERYGPLDIVFSGANNCQVSTGQVVKAECTGTSTQNRKKCDVKLFTPTAEIPVSVKKKNAEYWESADTYYGSTADCIIEHLVSKNIIQLEPTGKFRNDGTEKVRLKPEVAVKADYNQTLDIVFGNDLYESDGFVVKENFTQKNFNYQSGTLHISAETVINSIDTIPADLAVYLLIRNDSTRNRPSSNYPGLRVLGSYASRAKNAHIIDSKQVNKILQSNKKGH